MDHVQSINHVESVESINPVDPVESINPVDPVESINPVEYKNRIVLLFSDVRCLAWGIEMRPWRIIK